MRQSRRLMLAVSLAVVASLAVVLPAVAKGPPPTGTQLPFVIDGSTNTFICDGQDHGYFGGLTCAAGTPFYVEHGVDVPATTKGNKNAQCGAVTDNGFQLTVDGTVLSPTGSNVTVTGSSGAFVLNCQDWYSFPTGLTGPHTMVFTWYAGTSVLITETETYDFS